MRITLFISCASGGGAERVVCNLANYLVGKHHDVTLLLVSDEKSYYIDERVRCVCLKRPSDKRLPHVMINALRFVRLNRYLRIEEQDVYVTFLPKLTGLLLGQRKFYSAPVILAERADPGTYCRSSERNKKNFEKHYNLADGYVFQTEDAREFYRNAGINTENSVVIPNAINPAFVGKAYNGIRSKRVVGVGRLDAQKNFLLLIESFALLNETVPEYNLVIYGEGPQRAELQQKIEDLGLCDRVSLPGRTDNIIDAIKDSSLFVLSSDYEGMPNALAEAMALGIPSISTDCPAGGSKFLIKNGKNGILVPMKDPEAMASAMKKILVDGELAEQLSRNAVKIADELTAEKTYGAWEKFIVDTINTKQTER